MILIKDSQKGQLDRVYLFYQGIPIIVCDIWGRQLKYQHPYKSLNIKSYADS